MNKLVVKDSFFVNINYKLFGSGGREIARRVILK